MEEFKVIVSVLFWWSSKRRAVLYSSGGFNWPGLSLPAPSQWKKLPDLAYANCLLVALDMIGHEKDNIGKIRITLG